VHGLVAALCEDAGVSDMLDLRPSSGPRGQLARVLVVHSDPLTRNLLTEVLREIPANVETCEDGVSGRNLLMRRRFDLVIIGQWLPGMSGRSLADECMRGSEPTPVVILDTDGPLGEVVSGTRRAPARVSCPFSPIALIMLCRNEIDSFAAPVPRRHEAPSITPAIS